MGLFNWLFGGKSAAQKLAEQEDKLRKELEAAEKAAKAKAEKEAAEKRRIEALKPKKTEEQQALDLFESELGKKAVSLDKARDTLYTKKAQLKVMRDNQTKLKSECDALSLELTDVEKDYATAIGDERTDLEIRGQRLQLQINNTTQKIGASASALKTFEKTLDALERNISQNDIELNGKYTRLESAKVAVAVVELNNDINDTLQLGNMSVDESGLEVFSERQNQILEHLEGEIVPIVSAGGEGNLALPFKARMAKEAKDGQTIVVEE